MTSRTGNRCGAGGWSIWVGCAGGCGGGWVRFLVPCFFHSIMPSPPSAASPIAVEEAAVPLPATQMIATSSTAMTASAARTFFCSLVSSMVRAPGQSLHPIHFFGDLPEDALPSGAGIGIGGGSRPVPGVHVQHRELFELSPGRSDQHFHQQWGVFAVLASRQPVVEAGSPLLFGLGEHRAPPGDQLCADVVVADHRRGMVPVVD